tara:strand:+ start:78 stop:245 length:168 start_codon:yes stop_codon:yes gene_type:complete
LIINILLQFLLKAKLGLKYPFWELLQHYASCMTATDANAKLGKQFIKLSEQSYKD